MRREFEDIASRHNSLRTILKGDDIEELGGEKVYLENRPGFSPYVITKVIEGRHIKQLWVRSPRPGSMGQVVYTNLLMVPGEISNSDLARIYEKHLDTVEREAAAQVLIDVLMQVGGELIALRMAKIIGPGGAAAKSTQLLDNAQKVPLHKILDDAPNSGKLSNVEARKWYLEQEAKILGKIDPNLPLRDRAVQAFNRRNELRTQARELMADRELADKLMREEPNMTLRDLVKRKYQHKGLVGDELWQDILDSSQKSRTSVNKKLGLE